MEAVLKGLLPLLTILFTGAALLWPQCLRQNARQHLKGSSRPRRQTSVEAKTCALALLAAVACFGIAAWSNAPQHLQPTLPPVVEAKEVSRQACQAHLSNYDLASAADALRDIRTGRELSKDFQTRARPTLDHWLRTVNNHLFFGCGCMFAVLPAVLAALYHTLATSSTSSFKQQPKGALAELAANTWFELAPAVYAVLGCTMVAFCGYHFYMLEHQLNSCVLASGHWYTYVHTSFSCLVVLLHLLASPRSSNTSTSTPNELTPQGGGHHRLSAGAYAGFAALYQVLALQVLKTSQLFFHDATESVAGIKIALLVLPVSAVAAYFCGQIAAQSSTAAGSVQPASSVLVVEKVLEKTSSTALEEARSVPDLEAAAAAEAKAVELLDAGKHDGVSAADCGAGDSADVSTSAKCFLSQHQHLQDRLCATQQEEPSPTLQQETASAPPAIVGGTLAPASSRDPSSCCASTSALQGKGKGEGKGAPAGKGKGKGASSNSCGRGPQAAATTTTSAHGVQQCPHPAAPLAPTAPSNGGLLEQIRGFKKAKLKKPALQSSSHSVTAVDSEALSQQRSGQGKAVKAAPSLLDEIRGFQKGTLRKPSAGEGKGGSSAGGDSARQGQPAGGKKPIDLMSQLKLSLVQRRGSSDADECASDDDGW